MNVGNRPTARPSTPTGLFEVRGGRFRVAGRRWGRVAAEVALGAGLAGVLGFWAVRVADSWGGTRWVLDCVAGAVVCGFALVRRLDRLWAAVGGLAVAAVAVVAAGLADLPNEPGPAMALGLSVLVGSAIRALPPRPACAVAAGGLAV
ncbi:MAG: hypothetical protein HOV97_00450, partial [Nonomuraea sp.]|nr:hypothetical protein [Nonomuraea sp.]